jgi:prepilin-type N-terminal cleavage/methylation domain-containing protein
MTMLARIRRRAADERGFTLIELMVAASVGIVIVGAAFGMLDAVVRTFGTSERRVDVSQRGRLAVDVLTARLRSQVCGAGPTTASPSTAWMPSIQLATPDKVVFYANSAAPPTSGAAPAAQLRGLEYTTDGRILEYSYATGTTDPNATPATTREVATNVAPSNGGGLFKYYAYNPAAWDVNANPVPALYIELPSPTAAERPGITRITLAYTAYPENSSAADKLAADFTGDFVSRTAPSPYEFRSLPLASALEPRCQ